VLTNRIHLSHSVGHTGTLSKIVNH
jgi:hypothetical protein